uniref:Nitroreductase domain-containing protein n=1 Tax=Steinernema glaseri TaxID=37863 RepID=A0A1I7Y3X0_9BILA
MARSEPGVIRRIAASVTVEQLNILSAVAVIIFVYFQFRTFFKNKKKVAEKVCTENGRPATEKRKQTTDKLVGEDHDVVEDHDDVHVAREILYKAHILPENEMLRKSQLFYEQMKIRRSVRCFSSRSVPLKVIQNLIKTAGTSPSGANLQPWTFCVVGNDILKQRIREIVENEEQMNYSRRMGAKWVLDVSHLNVNWNKPYLTEVYQPTETGEKQPTYYNEISTCIATGFLLAAIQNCGLVTVTTTPLNSGSQIREVLQRPANEKVVLLLPVGYPAVNARVPDLRRKPLEDIIQLY